MKKWSRNDPASSPSVQSDASIGKSWFQQDSGSFRTGSWDAGSVAEQPHVDVSCRVVGHAELQVVTCGDLHLTADGVSSLLQTFIQNLIYILLPQTFLTTHHTLPVLSENLHINTSLSIHLKLTTPAGFNDVKRCPWLFWMG